MNIDITVRKDELLAVLEKNRANHKTEYEKAFDGFQKAAEEWLEEQLKRLRKGKVIDRPVFPHQVPQDHTDEYDQIIGMLRMDTSETVDLNWSLYRQFVDDEWGWTADFTTTNAFYTR